MHGQRWISTSFIGPLRNCDELRWLCVSQFMKTARLLCVSLLCSIIVKVHFIRVLYHIIIYISSHMRYSRLDSSMKMFYRKLRLSKTVISRWCRINVGRVANGFKGTLISLWIQCLTYWSLGRVNVILSHIVVIVFIYL